MFVGVTFAVMARSTKSFRLNGSNILIKLALSKIVVGAILLFVVIGVAFKNP
jgi:hypothetical protein